METGCQISVLPRAEFDGLGRCGVESMISAKKLKRLRNVPANKYHVLMPGQDDLPGAVGDLTPILLKSLRVKVAEALPAEIAAATHKRKIRLALCCRKHNQSGILALQTG